MENLNGEKITSRLLNVVFFDFSYRYEFSYLSNSLSSLHPR